MTRPLRLTVIIVLPAILVSVLAIILALLLLPATKSAAQETPIDPGAAWVLGGDSPVTTEPHYQNRGERAGELAERYAPELTDAWLYEYNHERPHGSLGGLTPAAFEQQHWQNSRSVIKKELSVVNFRLVSRWSLQETRGDSLV